jgi:hypothetical protein
MTVQIRVAEIIFLMAVIVVFSQGIPTVFTTIPNSFVSSLNMALLPQFYLMCADSLYCHALTFTSLTALCVIAPFTTTISAPPVHSHCQFPYFKTTFCHAWLTFLL